VLKTETVNEGAAATAPSVPARAGYAFVKWDAEFGSIVGDLTVTAVYAAITHTVTFLDGDGNVLKTETVNEGSAATAPTAPVREGYIFDGWNISFTHVTSDLTITALYREIGAPITYMVTFLDWDGTVLREQVVNPGAAATAPTAPTREGHTFTGWDVEFSNVTGHLSVTAEYIETQTPILNTIASRGLGIVQSGQSLHIVGTSQAMSLRIYNLRGNVVMSRTVAPNESVSVAHLPKGVYVARVGAVSVRVVR
jgi:hypothetical protein